MKKLKAHVHAAGFTTHTWTGGGGNNNMSTAANWDNTEVPDNADDIYFPSSSSARTVNNDLSGSVFFHNIGFGIGGSGSAAYNMTGTALGVCGLASAGTMPITFAQPVNFLTSNGCGNYAYGINAFSSAMTFSAPVGFEATLPVTGAAALTFNSYLAGVGSNASTVGINFNNAANVTLNAPSNGFHSTLFLNGTSLINVTNANSFGASDATVNENSTSTIVMTTGLTYPQNYILGGIVQAGSGSFTGAPPRATATLSGAVTFNTGSSFQGSYANLVLTGAVSGQSISVAAGATGDVVINGTSNTSTMANGTTEPSTLVTTISDAAASTSFTVNDNNTYVINGSRGAGSILYGGTLKGSGTVGALSVLTGGHVAPGNSPGCLNVGNTTMAGSLDIEIGGTTACTEYDQLRITGTISLTGGDLNTVRYNNFQPSMNQVYKIIDNDSTDAVTGTFNGLAEGATFVVDGYTFTISYVGGDGNDVTLTVTAIAANAGTSSATTSGAGTAAKVPGAPKTGLSLILSNPLIGSLTTIATSSALYTLSRKYRLFTK